MTAWASHWCKSQADAALSSALRRFASRRPVTPRTASYRLGLHTELEANISNKQFFFWASHWCKSQSPRTVPLRIPPQCSALLSPASLRKRPHTELGANISNKQFFFLGIHVGVSPRPAPSQCFAPLRSAELRLAALRKTVHRTDPHIEWGYPPTYEESFTHGLSALLRRAHRNSTFTLFQ